MEKLTFEYTGAVQTHTLEAGNYIFELWGAAGSKNGGKGGYVRATMILNEPLEMNIYIGGSGDSGSYNGGGRSGDINFGGHGGGATDIRIGGTELVNRIIVAGGGGGGGTSAAGGAGGGIIGGTGGNGGAAGGTQTSGNALGVGGGGTHKVDNSASQWWKEGADYWYSGGGGGYYGGQRGLTREYQWSSYYIEGEGWDYDQDYYDRNTGAGGGSGYVDSALFIASSMRSGTRDGNGLLTITPVDGNIDVYKLNIIDNKLILFKNSGMELNLKEIKIKIADDVLETIVENFESYMEFVISDDRSTVGINEILVEYTDVNDNIYYNNINYLRKARRLTEEESKEIDLVQYITNLNSAVASLIQDSAELLKRRGIDLKTNSISEIYDKLRIVNINNAPPWYQFTNMWATCKPLDSLTGDMCSVAMNNKAYCIGGAGDNGNFMNTLMIYDPVENAYDTMAPMITPRRTADAVVIDDKIYVIGGLNGTTHVNNNECYNSITNAWEAKTELPTGKSGLICEVVDGKIYCIGGNTGAVSKLNDCYDPVENTWTTMVEMTTARRGLTSSVVYGKIYCIGGYTTANAKVNECYDPGLNTWTKMADMTTARRSLASSSVNGKIYCFGGVNGSNKTECYDVSSNTWSTVANMSVARQYPTAVNINDVIYVIGGYTGSLYMDNNEVYIP